MVKIRRRFVNHRALPQEVKRVFFVYGTVAAIVRARLTSKTGKRFSTVGLSQNPDKTLQVMAGEWVFEKSHCLVCFV